MNPRIAAIAHEMRRLDDELALKLARKLEFAFTVRDRAVRFEQQALIRHKELKSRLSKYVFGARPLFLITAPVIYSLIVPLALLDTLARIYQWACFPVHGIARVPRGHVPWAELRYTGITERLAQLEKRFEMTGT